jgi:hypothetical protein
VGIINMGVRVVDFASVSTIYLSREGAREREREREREGRLDPINSSFLVSSSALSWKS